MLVDITSCSLLSVDGHGVLVDTLSRSVPSTDGQRVLVDMGISSVL